MESNQGIRKDNFLMDTIMEDNFIPPSPDNIKYCSTALKKERTRGDSQEFSIAAAVQEKEKSSEIARELFGNDKKGADITIVTSNNKAIKSTLRLNQTEKGSETWVIPSNTNRSIIKQQKEEPGTKDSENALSNQTLIKKERKIYKPPILKKRTAIKRKVNTSLTSYIYTPPVGNGVQKKIRPFYSVPNRPKTLFSIVFP